MAKDKPGRDRLCTTRNDSREQGHRSPSTSFPLFLHEQYSEQKSYIYIKMHPSSSTPNANTQVKGPPHQEVSRVSPPPEAHREYSLKRLAKVPPPPLPWTRVPREGPREGGREFQYPLPPSLPCCPKPGHTSDPEREKNAKAIAITGSWRISPPNLASSKEK